MVASQPGRSAPATIPLTTDKIVASRMMRIKEQISDARGREVQWWEVLEDMADAWDQARRET